jgi:hypothetical protein
MATIETRIRHARIGLVCVAIAAAGLIFSAVGAKVVAGFSLPHYFVLFSLLGDAYCAFFFLWILKRLKKQQSEGQTANPRKPD